MLGTDVRVIQMKARWTWLPAALRNLIICVGLYTHTHLLQVVFVMVRFTGSQLWVEDRALARCDKYCCKMETEWPAPHQMFTLSGEHCVGEDDSKYVYSVILPLWGHCVHFEHSSCFHPRLYRVQTNLFIIHWYQIRNVYPKRFLTEGFNSDTSLIVW